VALHLRKVWTVVVGAWVAAFTTQAVLDWLLGFDGPWVAAAVVVAAVLGGAAGLGEARALRPLDPDERRDTVLGWVVILGAAVAVACFILPLPWSVFAIVGTIALTVLALRHVPRSESSGAISPRDSSLSR
jgi:hypothetical protein